MANQYGRDTTELLRRIAAWQPGTRLDLYGLQITNLPPLPDGLKDLTCDYTNLTSLPSLPDGLHTLTCGNTPLTSLPQLPNSIIFLYCGHTRLTNLPSLPTSLQFLSCYNTPLILQRGEDESIQAYEARWAEWRLEIASKERVKERCIMIKEDLMAAAWHPRRVERWLEAGGWDAIECM